VSRLARIWQRWEISPAEQTALPFHTGLALLNIKRVELGALMVIANAAIEGLFRPGYSGTIVEVGAALLLLAAAWRMRGAPPRVQGVVVALSLVVGLGSTQLIIYQIASATGQISSGYPIRLLTLTLLFVLRPKALAIMLASALISYCVFMAATPTPAGIKFGAIVNAVIVSAICLVAGTLVYSARRSDHHQKMLISAQNTELDQLMAITAHDLRSPLFGLRNLFDLAARRAEHEPALPLRVMRDGIASLDAMLALVNRLLDAHRAEHAPLGLLASEDVRAHVVAAAKRLAPRAEAAGVSVDVQLAAAPLCARVDAGALAQILDNLLDNAVRFSPAGAPLRLTAAERGSQAVIAVEDRGPGIDPAQGVALFDKFHRGTAKGDSAKAGTGMGLFIAATFAGRIGATLSHKPATPRGAIFELSLPIIR